MKHWINKNYKSLITVAFLVPIIIVAIVSISHVTKWYGISNPTSWAIYLSFGIEIAALSSIAAISANMGKKIYLPFIIVTLVQFIGNIYFSYNYIDINDESFKSWVDLSSPLVGLLGVASDDLIAHKRVLALFSGGLLPIISLSFLHFLVKFTEENRITEEKESKQTITTETEERTPTTSEENEEENAINENISTIDNIEPVTNISTNEQIEEQKQVTEENVVVSETIEEQKQVTEENDVASETIETKDSENIVTPDEAKPIGPKRENFPFRGDGAPIEIYDIDKNKIGIKHKQQISDNTQTTPSESNKKANQLKTFLRNVENSKRVIGK